MSRKMRSDNVVPCTQRRFLWVFFMLHVIFCCAAQCGAEWRGLHMCEWSKMLLRVLQRSAMLCGLCVNAA